MRTLVFLLEEPSMEACLGEILPRFLSVDIVPRFIVFEGKQDLEKRFADRILHWQGDASFIVIRDQDNGDCYHIKQRLKGLAQHIDKPILFRIMCHELETIYLGDLSAVQDSGLAFKRVAHLQQKKKYRTPDTLSNAKEELRKICNYEPIAGSRAISKKLNLKDNKSHCFKVLIEGILKQIDNVKN